MWFRKKKTKYTSDDKVEILVSNLPDEIGVFELGILLSDFIGHFHLKIFDKAFENGEQCRFCIATFDSERLARKATKKLRKSKFGKRQLEVHKYIYRTYSNERRDLHWRDLEWNDKERRDHERRRQEHIEQVDDLFADPILKKSEASKESIRITAYGNLARKG